MLNSSNWHILLITIILYIQDIPSLYRCDKMNHPPNLNRSEKTEKKYQVVIVDESYVTINHEGILIC